MLTWPGGTKVFVGTAPTDMRCGFDALARRVREFLGQDPLGGGLFVFRNKRGDRLKVLYWDADGLALWYKRLEEGTFRRPATPADAAHPSRVEVAADDLGLILRGIDPADVRRQPRYRRPDPSRTARHLLAPLPAAAGVERVWTARRPSPLPCPTTCRRCTGWCASCPPPWPSCAGRWRPSRSASTT